jgi:hypothetical protein
MSDVGTSPLSDVGYIHHRPRAMASLGQEGRQAAGAARALEAQTKPVDRVDAFASGAPLARSNAARAACRTRHARSAAFGARAVTGLKSTRHAGSADFYDTGAMHA